MFCSRSQWPQKDRVSSHCCFQRSLTTNSASFRRPSQPTFFIIFRGKNHRATTTASCVASNSQTTASMHYTAVSAYRRRRSIAPPATDDFPDPATSVSILVSRRWSKKSAAMTFCTRNPRSQTGRRRSRRHARRSTFAASVRNSSAAVVIWRGIDRSTRGNAATSALSARRDSRSRVRSSDTCTYTRTRRRTRARRAVIATRHRATCANTCCRIRANDPTSVPSARSSIRGRVTWQDICASTLAARTWSTVTWVRQTSTAVVRMIGTRRLLANSTVWYCSSVCKHRVWPS